MQKGTLHIFTYWLGLIISSCLFAYKVSLNPPEQKDNPIAVIGGVVMTLVFLLPSQLIALNKNKVLLLLLMPLAYFSTSLGIVSTVWFTKHKTEEAASEAYFELYKRR